MTAATAGISSLAGSAVRDDHTNSAGIAATAAISTTGNSSSATGITRTAPSPSSSGVAITATSTVRASRVFIADLHSNPLAKRALAIARRDRPATGVPRTAAVTDE